MNEQELQILYFSVKNAKNDRNPIPTRNFLLKYPSLLSALWAGSMVKYPSWDSVVRESVDGSQETLALNEVNSAEWPCTTWGFRNKTESEIPETGNINGN